VWEETSSKSGISSLTRGAAERCLTSSPLRTEGPESGCGTGPIKRGVRVRTRGGEGGERRGEEAGG